MSRSNQHGTQSTVNVRAISLKSCHSKEILIRLKMKSTTVLLRSSLVFSKRSRRRSIYLIIARFPCGLRGSSSRLIRQPPCSLPSHNNFAWAKVPNPKPQQITGFIFLRSSYRSFYFILLKAFFFEVRSIREVVHCGNPVYFTYLQQIKESLTSQIFQK